MLEKFEGITPLQESTETIQEIASRNFDLWNSALQTGNPKEVAGLYITDATFFTYDFRGIQEGAIWCGRIF